MKTLVPFDHYEWTILMGVSSKKTDEAIVYFIYDKCQKIIRSNKRAEVKETIDKLAKIEGINWEMLFTVAIILRGTTNSNYMSAIHQIFDGEIDRYSIILTSPTYLSVALNEIIKLDESCDFLKTNTVNQLKFLKNERLTVLSNQSKEFFKHLI